MKYKKYPSYKDSGVEWLGEIPTEWVVSRNKIAFQFVKSLVGKESNNYQLLSLTLNGIIPRDIESGKGKFPAEFDTYQKVEKDDLIFCLFDIDETPRTIGISNYDGMITGAYNVVRCTPLANPKFIYYYYLSIDEYKGLKPFYTGLRKVVRAETFMNIQLALPSIKEQQLIANFLDKATAKIDTLIEKQTKQIELLKEKRQAVISHAVTKGINLNVSMKDSGVEWLGVIPEHWTCLSIGYISKIDSGATPNRDKNSYWGGNIPWIKTGEVNYSIIEDSQEKITMAGFLNSSLKLAKKGTILMAMYGQGVTRGRIAVLGIDATYNQACAAINFNHKMSNEFAQYFFIASYNYNRDLGNETSQMNLNIAIINKMKITLPPLEEQQQIANYLDNKTSKIDTLIEKSKKSIELLKEKRTALISAAVTGKIDIRELV